jgi:hypothetical protein
MRLPPTCTSPAASPSVGGNVGAPVRAATDPVGAKDPVGATDPVGPVDGPT